MTMAASDPKSRELIQTVSQISNGLMGEVAKVIIGKQENKISVSDYVLNDFNDEEKTQLDQITINIIDSIPILIDKKLDLFSSTVNNK